MSAARTTGASVVLLTRTPVPGHTKTRLLPALSPQECAQLQETMLLDAAERLARLAEPDGPAGRLVVCFGDDADTLPDPEARALRDRFFRSVHAAAPLAELSPQRGTGLGARMGNAIDDELARGAQGCVLLGSDLPLAAEGLVREALRALQTPGSDAVLCPTEDGGYWLVGLARPCPELFSHKRYGTGDVFAQALAACEHAGLRVAAGPATRDVDTPDDLAWLEGLVRAGDVRVGPRTAAWVRAREQERAKRG